MKRFYMEPAPRDGYQIYDRAIGSQSKHVVAWVRDAEVAQRIVDLLNGGHQ